jgi:hypothetical protein
MDTQYIHSLKLKVVRNLKIFFLASTIVGFFSLIGCSKSNNNNNNSSSGKDSIYYSQWMTIAMQPTDAGDTIYTETISAPKVTSAVADGGAVLSYLCEPGFPNTGDTTVTNAVEFGMYTTFVPGSIQLTTLGYLNDYSTSITHLLYRYVVIPGTVLTTKGLTPKQARSLTYAEVTKLIGSPARQTESPTIQ